MNTKLVGAAAMGGAALLITALDADPWSWPTLPAAALAAGAAALLVRALQAPGSRPAMRGALIRAGLVGGALVATFLLVGGSSLVQSYSGSQLHLEIVALALTCAAGLLILAMVTAERA